MPGSPDQNGVVKIRNRTLMDMARSMLSNSNLPNFLWTSVLNILTLFKLRLFQRHLLNYGKVGIEFAKYACLGLSV